MTLILTLATPFYVLQVGDRLVSQDGKEYDASSNKAVVYQAKDGVIAISYAGQAYIDKTPTDKWIAEAVNGEPVPDEVTARFSIGRRSSDLGQGLERLRAKCDEVYSRTANRPSNPLEIVASGWQWKRGIGRPTLLWISQEGGGGARFVIERAPRHWYLKRQQASGEASRFLAADTPHRKQLSRALGDRLGLLLHSFLRAPDITEELLIKAIRITAQEHASRVGANCMSILIPPPSIPRVRVRYSPAANNRAVGEAFTPWVIGPSVAAKPSTISGAASIVGGHYTIDFDVQGTDEDPHIFRFNRHERRPYDGPN